MTDKINRVVLAYSGGLDTSVILKWLQVTYNCEVVTFTADLGQGEELEPARAKAQLLGIPDDVTQVALLPVAHYTGDGFSPAARPPAETVTHWDGWQGGR